MKNVLSKYGLFIILILFLSLAAAAQKAPATQFPPERGEAFALFDKGNYSEAIRMLSRQTKLNSQDAEAWDVLGLAYLETGKAKEGRKACQKAVKLSPDQASYRINLAQAFLAENKIGAAIKESDRAVELAPNDKTAYYTRGLVSLWQGMSQLAVENAENAIRIDPTYSSAYILKADALLQIFSGEIRDGVGEVSDLSALKNSIETLDACAAKCDKRVNTKTLSERSDSLGAFLKYFERKISKDPSAKPAPLPDGATPLKIVAKSAPAYTEEARKNGVSGAVRLAVLFSADGKTIYVFPIKQLGNGLTEQAIRAAFKIKFEPQMIDGKPVSVVKVVEYQFELR